MRPRRGALVTGAAGGLGLQIAAALARDGYAVHLTDVDRDAVLTAADGVGGSSWGSVLDVRDEAACRTAAQETADRAGGLDVWVNNAGILATGLSWEHPSEQRALLFDVNVNGTINGTLAALEVMRPLDRGHVINIVSLAGLVAPPGETLYAATKHAALAFSVGTLYDLRRSGHAGIHVSALCPDGIWTPMLEKLVDDPEAALSWSGTLLAPEEVAARVLKLIAKPQAVRSMPRWRGAVARLYAVAPRLGLAVAPRVMAEARRRQEAWKRSSTSSAP